MKHSPVSLKKKPLFDPGGCFFFLFLPQINTISELGSDPILKISFTKKVRFSEEDQWRIYWIPALDWGDMMKVKTTPPNPPPEYFLTIFGLNKALYPPSFISSRLHSRLCRLKWVFCCIYGSGSLRRAFRSHLRRLHYAHMKTAMVPVLVYSSNTHLLPSERGRPSWLLLRCPPPLHGKPQLQGSSSSAIFPNRKPNVIS